MKIIEFNSSFMDQTLSLCRELKNNDSNPCSFWGYDEKTLTNSFDRGDQKTLIAIREDNKVLGIGTLTKGGPFQNHSAEIGVAIHPLHRKAGLAAKLTSSLEALTGELNIEFIKALILENNTSSRSFFERQGYELMATLIQEFKIEGFGNLNDCAYYKFLIAK